ncbi:CHC2 zinc finger domain-containing protein [Streptomyces sp. 4F14]|uniref:CHC2 zinc finger domain-containing protein n=1 Tax=Streptomyces sp. 4F14 TaxID=3394380 RepID=UPI003A87D740
MDEPSALKPPIGRILAHYYGLELGEKRGRVRVACPLPSHPDSVPSASVDLDKDRWACFACNLSEDSYSVIMREEGFGFTDAQKFARTEFSGDGKGVPPELQGEPSRGVRQGSRPGRDRREVRTRLRRFGEDWA